MQPTYIVLGGDGNQYGPITVEQFQAWAREGRVNGQTQVSNGSGSWAAAASIPELFGTAPSSLPTSGSFGIPASDPVRDIDPDALRAIKSGASWFYWIAGLSVVNSVMAAIGADWRFLFGLGVTQLFDDFGAEFGGSSQMVALALSLLTAGLFVLFGVMGGRQHSWAFIVGMILFALDGVLCALFQDWFSVGFHILALFFIFKGLQANRAAAA